MAKKTKTQQVIETTNVINDVLAIIETAANTAETTAEAPMGAETVTNYDVISVAPDASTSVATLAPINKDQISAAIETLQTSVKTLRKEVVTLRSIVRCICDNASDVKIAPLAAFFGLAEDSNKNARNMVVANIAKKYPYYSEVVSDNGAIHTQAMRLTKKADGVYMASVENDCFKAITAVIDNVFCAI